jgi:hypothetical protein
MAKVGGLALRIVATLLYALAFCCAAIVLALYSYFLASEASHDMSIPPWQKAVEGMSGIGVVYTIFAIILTCCLGGIAFFAFLGIVLDLLLVAAFVAIAVLCRDGTSCSGDYVKTPLGNGNPNSHTGRDNKTINPSLFTVCRLNTVCFAVGLIGAFIFLISALFQLWLGRHHQREKRYGPSPANNYGSGSGVRWFRRRRGAKSAHAAAAKDAEVGAFSPTVVGGHHTNGYTNGHTTVATDDSYVGNKYETTQHNAGIPTAGGYHTGPAGTSVNPYGYDNTHRTAGTNF